MWQVSGLFNTDIAMKRNIIIGIVAFLVCGAVIGNCMDDCSARKESKAQEKFYAMIDEGKLDEARDMVRDMEGSGKYKCAEMLIEECIAQGDVEGAVNVYERLTPRHCSTYEMQYDGLYGHDGYERRVTKLLYDALIAHDDFDKAWDYHALDYEEPDYPGNAQQYSAYMTDVLVHLCQAGRQDEAQRFLDTKGLWFQKNVDNHANAEEYAKYTYREMTRQLQAVINSNYNAAASSAATATGKAKLLEHKTAHPVYLMPGDVLRYRVEGQRPMTVNICNADARTVLKRHRQARVDDSLRVDYAAVYLVEIDPGQRQYVTADVSFTPAPGTPSSRPRVFSEQVACRKGDFGATGVEGIKMTNLFREPRKFTLRGQIKSAFSGTSRAIVAVQVPQGATDILYTLRISTSEQARAEDGKFNENLMLTYRRINILGIPVYEGGRSSGIIASLLDDNHPIREEDAYCNLYVFRNQADARKFQDGTASTGALKYDVDCSTLGTQSCNGSIPAKGTKTLYLGFENERMRYTNYLWLEAVAAGPSTEYYTYKYTIR